MYLTVPKPRKGGCIPFFVTKSKCSEIALMNVIQEAFINGVSTRKIEKLAKSLGIDSISRIQVSNITKELQAQIDEFLNQDLNQEYPVLWMDGTRDILAIEPRYEESKASYNHMFESLKARGLKNVWLVVSDAHKDLVASAKRIFHWNFLATLQGSFYTKHSGSYPSKGEIYFCC